MSSNDRLVRLRDALKENELDAILERYVEQDMSAEAVIRDGLPNR